MLGLGWQEIMLIGVLAVVVVGPERLPEMLRFVGRQYAKIRRTSDELRRAFMLEADRADAEKRAAELRKRRAQAAARAEEVRRRAMEAQGGQPDLSGLEEDVPHGAVPSSVGEVPEPAQNPSKEGEQT
jgi:sec-independent protein translocase protein TatB